MRNYTKNKRITKVTEYLKKVFAFVGRTLVLVVVLKYALIAPGRVHGTSMEPTYYGGGNFIVNKLAYVFDTPKRLQVVQVVDPTNEQKFLIKRVIGLPGETVHFVANKVVIEDANGKKTELDEAYLSPGMVTRTAMRTPSQVFIPPHHYYVMGDNRLASRDSREIGPIHRKYINGLITQLTRGQQPGSLH